MYSYAKQKETFDLQERQETTILNTNKNFFSDNHIFDIIVYFHDNFITHYNPNCIFTVQA